MTDWQMSVQSSRRYSRGSRSRIFTSRRITGSYALDQLAGRLLVAGANPADEARERAFHRTCSAPLMPARRPQLRLRAFRANEVRPGPRKTRAGSPDNVHWARHQRSCLFAVVPVIEPPLMISKNLGKKAKSCAIRGSTGMEPVAAVRGSHEKGRPRHRPPAVETRSEPNRGCRATRPPGRACRRRTACRPSSRSNTAQQIARRFAALKRQHGRTRFHPRPARPDSNEKDRINHMAATFAPGDASTITGLGFDAAASPPWLMVPADPTGTKMVLLKGGDNLSLQLANTARMGTLTFKERPGTAAGRPIAITGMRPGTVRLEARDTTGARRPPSRSPSRRKGSSRLSSTSCSTRAIVRRYGA